MNKYNYFIYGNPYNLKQIRFSYLTSLGTTLIGTGLLAAINPLFAALMLYDYYSLMRFGLVLNSTVFSLILHRSKRHINIDSLNALGFRGKLNINRRYKLSQIRYVGVVNNTFIGLDYIGVPPSIARLL